MVKQTEWQVEMRTTFTQVSLATYRYRSGTYTHGTSVFICKIKQNFRLQGKRLHCYGLTGVSSPNSYPQCHSIRRGAFGRRSRSRWGDKGGALMYGLVPSYESQSLLLLLSAMLERAASSWQPGWGLSPEPNRAAPCSQFPASRTVRN